MCEGVYSLSVLDDDAEGGQTVKHYRIRSLDTGGVFIATHSRFSSVEQLVEHYSSKDDAVLPHEATRRDASAKRQGRRLYTTTDPNK